MVGSSKLLCLFEYWNEEGEKALAEVRGKKPSEIEAKLWRLAKDAGIKESDDEAFAEFCEKFAAHHEREMNHNQMMKTPYPKPTTDQAYTLVYETFQHPIEAYYFWCINQLEDLSYPIIEKVTDIFAASEHSSMYGVGQQRLSLAQQKVTEFLVSIGRLVRELLLLMNRSKGNDKIIVPSTVLMDEIFDKHSA